MFAWDSLNHVYGLDTVKTPGVSMDDVKGFQDLPLIDRYDPEIRRIAETAPVRICPDEKISGAATLGLSISHCVPFTFNGGSCEKLLRRSAEVIKFGGGILAFYNEDLIMKSFTAFGPRFRMERTVCNNLQRMAGYDNQ